MHHYRYRSAKFGTVLVNCHDEECPTSTPMYCQIPVQNTPGIQWNPSISDTIGDQHFVPYSKVSLTQGLPVWSVSGRHGMRNRAVVWLRFQSFPLLYAGREGYAEASTTSVH